MPRKKKNEKNNGETAQKIFYAHKNATAKKIQVANVRGVESKMVSTDYRVGGKLNKRGRVVYYVRHDGRIIATGFRTRRAAELYARRHFRRHAGPGLMRMRRRRVRRVRYRRARRHKRHKRKHRSVHRRRRKR